MHRHPLRSALQRTRDAAPLAAEFQVCIRTFSTTPTRWEDNNDAKPNPKSTATFRERSAAAAQGLSAMNNANNIIRRADPSDAAARIDARSMGASRGGLTDSNVISVRSLPRRRGTSFPGPSGVSTPSQFRSRRTADGNWAPSTGYRGRGGPRGGGFARSRGRGGRGGRESGGREDRGGRRKRRGKRSGKEEEDDGQKGWSLEEQAYLDDFTQGVQTDFTPSLTLESLVGHGPAIATKTERSLGQVEGVMRSMRTLGGGVPFCDDVASPSWMQNKLRIGERVFFDTLNESHGKPKPPKPDTREAILKSVVRGQYMAPEFAPPTDILGTLRSYHRKDGTYRPQDGPSLEAHVSKLVPAKSPETKQAVA